MPMSCSETKQRVGRHGIGPPRHRPDALKPRGLLAQNSRALASSVVEQSSTVTAWRKANAPKHELSHGAGEAGQRDQIKPSRSWRVSDSIIYFFGTL